MTYRLITRKLRSAEEVLAINLSDYDLILIVPQDDGYDWQWERDKVAFCQGIFTTGGGLQSLPIWFQQVMCAAEPGCSLRTIPSV